MVVSQTNYMAFPAAVWCRSVITRQSCDCLDTRTRHNDSNNATHSYCKEIRKGQPSLVLCIQCQKYLMCFAPANGAWVEGGKKKKITDRCDL